MQEKPGHSAIFIRKFDLLALRKWRRGWDSNPRYGSPYARFRGEYFQPLSHLSAVVASTIVAEASISRQCVGGPCAKPRCNLGMNLCACSGKRGIVNIEKRAGRDKFRLYYGRRSEKKDWM